MRSEILVVDDDDEIQETLREILEDEGYRVAVAGNGAEALERLRVRRPALIFLDLMMPVMNGARFRAVQLAEAAWADIPTVVLTAQTLAPGAERELRATRLLAKPVSLRELLEIARLYCALRSGGGEGCKG